MTVATLQPALQRSTLRLYGELLCRSDAWGGKLALACFRGSGTSGFSAAASLAGAASLCVDDDIASLKLHFRDGAFDFLVNTLDEALRALKNEIRRGRPLAVALSGNPEKIGEEMSERGVAPDIVLYSGKGKPPSGRRQIVFSYDSEAPAAASADLNRWLAVKAWQVAEIAPSLVDAGTILASNTSDGSARMRFLKGLVKHQRSASTSLRTLWMTDEERDQLNQVR